MSKIGQSSSNKERKAAARALLQLKAEQSGKGEMPETDKYEDELIGDIVFPDEIDASMYDIGGMDKLKQEIHESVILPLTQPQLFQSLHATHTDTQGTEQQSLSAVISPLLSAPKGVLFYGPPGTGKSMMAKAIAKQSFATFLNVKSSTLQNKWFGESQKLVRAVFSLAAKFSPTIIFIDEIDMLLRKRNGQDHEAYLTMKGEFMQLWDGLLNDPSIQITVLGATNRPYDLDEAALRRFSRQFLFNLPNPQERTAILKVMMKGVKLDADVNFAALAEPTISAGYSGSDLKEVCRYAVMQPIRALLSEHRRSNQVTNGMLNSDQISGSPRAVCHQDFLDAFRVIQATGQESMQYLLEFQQREALNRQHR